MLLHVVHETRYRYSPSVENAHHVVVLKPASGHGQTLLRYALDVSPAPIQLHESRDGWGNVRTYFSLQSVHAELCVTSDSLVQTSAGQLDGGNPAAIAGLRWEAVREQFRYRANASYDSASEFLFASPYIPRDEAFVEFAQPCFVPGRPLLEAAQLLMNRIHKTMIYESESTQVNTPALSALRQGKGVCQDFAHIMVACCRAVGLPARYVSGYMLTNPPPGQARLIGCDASHAWASIYCPGNMAGTGQWLDFDPTNNRMPGEDYVTVATGRDFLDVSPMRGVIRGGARHILTVAVTVEPSLQNSTAIR